MSEPTPELTPDERAVADMSEAYLVVFTGSAIGQRVWADLQASCFLWQTTVSRDSGGGVDMAATLRNEGARSVVLAIQRHINKGRAGFRPPQREATPSIGRG